MPLGFRAHPLPYMEGGSPTSYDVLLGGSSTTMYKPGELGQHFAWGAANAIYQIVQVDSGPSSVAAGDLAFWKTKASYIVTNKLADSNRNQIAGVFVKAISNPASGGSGVRHVVCIQVGGNYASVKTTGSPAAGAVAVANTGASADAAGVAEGTAPTCIPLGIFTATAAGGVAPVDLIPPFVQ